ncbi:MOSC domain-containing protein [Roseobacter sp. EG26]|uniref:MOSC domain-containing protein n=1 Tax=Roseobacter sp. EG26 TaxID=3412477 RepID=UPI003CE4555B
MTPPDLKTAITGLFTGKIQIPWRDKPASAIHKTAVSGKQVITSLGFENDAQADLSVHGGADKALHHYAADHYAAWQKEGMIPQDQTPAAFGENISTFGLTEDQICIGDIFHLGSALIQISQGRQPCWKLNAYTANDAMAYQFQKSGRTGWYYRVLETGSVAVGDEIKLVDRPNPSWTVAFVTRARLSRKISAENARKLARVAELADGWRTAFEAMAAGQTHENTDRRLKGPSI